MTTWTTTAQSYIGETWGHLSTTWAAETHTWASIADVVVAYHNWSTTNKS